jgi:hypothetical protein
MTDTIAPAAVTHTVLSGWSHDPIQCGIPQRVFGELIQIAAPVVKHYHSDMYHDAIMLQRHITDDSIVTFTYVVRDNGTHLNIDHEWSSAVVQAFRNDPGARVFSAAVICDERGEWTLAMSEMLPVKSS